MSLLSHQRSVLYWQQSGVMIEKALCASEQFTWKTFGPERALLWPSGTLICACLHSEKQLCCVRTWQQEALSLDPGGNLISVYLFSSPVLNYTVITQ